MNPKNGEILGMVPGDQAMSLRYTNNMHLKFTIEICRFG